MTGVPLRPFSRLSALGRMTSYLLFLVLLFEGPVIGGSKEEVDPGSDRDRTLSLAEALKKGKIGLNLQYRYEDVSDDAPAVTSANARASTLRSALSYGSRPFHGFLGFVEFENVSVIGNDLYNNRGAGDLANNVTDRPVVADPKFTKVNQAYLSFSLGDTTVKAGREEILLGNVRFVGNVGWRQNHQSFDAASVVNRSIANTTLTYAYLFKVNRIFGDRKPMDSHILNAAIRTSATSRLVTYAYLLDYSNAGDYGLSTATFGANFSGNAELDQGWRLLYDLEYAKQNDHADNPAQVNADYYRVEAGASRGTLLTVKVGHELLEGSPGDGQFNTPLATLHVWNGWADKFLRTPANGLADTYFSVGTKPGKFGVTGVYHWFRADEGSDEYGTEADLLFTYSSPWKQLFAVKLALYSADTHAADTNKIMFFTAFKF